MQQRVQEFLDSVAKKKFQQKEDKKAELLKSLGLTVKEKHYIENAATYGGSDIKRDADGKYYYESNSGPLPVTDEEYEAILKAIEGLEPDKDKEESSSPTQFLNVMSIILLAVSVISIIAMVIAEQEGILAYSFGLLLSALIIFAFNRVIISIDNRLNDINKIIKGR